MPSIFSNLWVASPQPKSNDSPAAAPDPVPTMSTSTSRLGAKRKSKVNPYEDMDPEDEMQRTPSSHRANSRNSSSTPSTRPKSNTKLARKNRTPGSSIIAATSVARSSPAIPKQRNEITAIIQNVKNQSIIAEPREEISRVVEAPMMGDGDAILALNDNEIVVPAAESGGEASDVDLGTVRVERTTEESEEEEEDDNEEPEADAGAADEEEEKEEEEEAETAEEVEEEEGEVHELKALLKHRYTGEGVELLVHWAGETIDEATWEPEEEIQRGADEMLYEYWGKKKGRSAALFTGRKGAPPEEYHVFKVLNHDKKPKNGGFSMEVQWVGYSATALDTTWEPESKLRKIAPTLLDEYWDGLGGRDNFLGKRGRGKRARLS